MRGAWWADGVHFSCQPDCGRCCDEPGGIVYLSRADAQRLAEHAGLGVKEFLKRDCTTTLDGRYVQLWPRIGWKTDGVWTRYPGAFTWSLDAPEGHMPLINQLRGVRLMDALLSHPDLVSHRAKAGLS